MRVLFASLCLAFSLSVPASAQLSLIDGPNIQSEAPVYVDADGKRHSTLIKVRFHGPVVDVPVGTTALALSDIGLDEVEIEDNGGPGIAARNGGQVNVAPSVASLVFDNDGGLYATSGGGIQAGICGTFGCTQAIHQITGNNGGTAFDARSLGGTSLYAQNDWWGTPDASAVQRDEDSASLLVYLPVATAPSLGGGGMASLWTDAPTDGTANKGGPDDRLSPAARLADAAQRAWFDEHHALALAKLRAAFQTARSDDDQRLVYEAGVRILGAADPALAAPMRTWLGNRAEGASRPWVLRVLAVAHDQSGDLGGARARAAALTSEYPDSAHGRWGLAAGVRLAVGAGDLARAASLGDALRRQWPDSDEAADADVLLGLVGAAPENGFAGPAASASKTGTAADGARTTALGPVAPNPSRRETAVPLTLAEAAHVRASVFDVLGREVAVLADRAFEAGEHAFAVAASQLAPGTYVVRAEVAPDGAAPRALVRTFTVVR